MTDPAPASDDEMTPDPRHPYMTAEKYRLSIFGLIKQDDEWPNTVADLMDGFEAAIRAPLEAALETAHRAKFESDAQGARDQAQLIEQLAAVTAERDEAREFIRGWAGAVGGLGVPNGFAKTYREAANEFLRPPSTAAPATEEVQG